MNTRRPVAAIINTLAASGDNIFDDTTAEQWCLCTLNTDDPVTNLHEPIPYGKTLKVETFNAVVEARQIVMVGGDTVEVIASSTRYKLEIHNPEDKYESHEQPPAVHAFTSAITLSGNAYTDRLNVYQALVAKVNSYAGNNVAAYSVTVAQFTLGTSVGDAATNFIIGENVTQETSSETARILKCTITSGTFAGDDAAGEVLLFGLSTEGAAWLVTAKTLTADGTVAGVSTNCVITVTNVTTYHGQGIALEDDAGYFTSNLGRPGRNWVNVTQGFTIATAVVQKVAAYAMGVGSVMAALKPSYDFSKQMVSNHGDLEYEFTNGDLVDSAKFYTKIVITVKGGDQDAIDARNVEIQSQFVYYLDESNSTNLTNLKSALTTAAAK